MIVILFFAAYFANHIRSSPLSLSTPLAAEFQYFLSYSSVTSHHPTYILLNNIKRTLYIIINKIYTTALIWMTVYEFFSGGGTLELRLQCYNL